MGFRLNIIPSQFCILLSRSFCSKPKEKKNGAVNLQTQYSAQFRAQISGRKYFLKHHVATKYAGKSNDNVLVLRIIASLKRVDTFKRLSKIFISTL